MEIHAPEAPIRSAKDFFLHLLTITAGVLIALSLEGLVEWNHHRTLVREARETITRELEDNKKELEHEMATVDEQRKTLDSAFAFANALLKKAPLKTAELSLSTSFAELSAANWQTAERTGALGYMEYTEVQRYSRAYAVQEIYVEHQRRTLEQLTAAMALFGNGDPALAPLKDVDAFRDRILMMKSALEIAQTLAAKLVGIYDKTLAPTSR